MELRSVFKIVIPATDIGLQPLENRRLAHPNGNRNLVVSPIAGRLADKYGSRVLTTDRVDIKRCFTDLVFHAK